MVLNLLYKTVKNDTQTNRAKSFIKRILQVRAGKPRRKTNELSLLLLIDEL